MNINLHIERLVFDGVSLAPNQRHLLQASIEAELARLLTEGGLTQQLGQGLTVPKLTGAHIQINQGNNPAQLGQQIAASVYSGIGQGAGGATS